VKVKLNDVIEGMEFADMEADYYYHTKTEAVVVYMDEALTGVDASELAEDIEENWQDNIHLPTKYEIDEYNMMEEFIWSLPEGAAQDKFKNLIRGRGAFRRFKDSVYDLNLQDKWYAYRDAAYVKQAKEWCERHGIECVM